MRFCSSMCCFTYTPERLNSPDRSVVCSRVGESQLCSSKARIVTAHAYTSAGKLYCRSNSNSGAMKPGPYTTAAGSMPTTTTTTTTTTMTTSKTYDDDYDDYYGTAALRPKLNFALGCFNQKLC